MSFTSNPIRRAMGTSLFLARSRSSVLRAVSSLLILSLRISIFAHERWLPGTPPNGGRREQKDRLPSLPAHRQTPFGRSSNEHCQLPGIDIGTNFPLLLPLLNNRLQTLKPRMESMPSLVAKVKVAVIGFDCGVQKRAPPRTRPVRLSLKFCRN